MREIQARPRRSGLAAGLILAIAFLIALGGSANAHGVWFNIWGYNVDMWSGVNNHYWRSPYCFPNCPYDYMTPQQAQVKQTSSGSFYWQIFEVGAGQVFSQGCCAYGYKGHLWVYGPGGYVYDSIAFNCDDVRTYGSLLTFVWSTGSPGRWDQDSGAGGANCFYAYAQTDTTVVYAAP